MLYNYFDEERENYEQNLQSLNEFYLNKDNFQTFFPDKLYGKEGQYFFPGTITDVYLFVQYLPEGRDKEFFFKYFDPESLLKDKVNSWSYNQLACSTLYFYINLRLSLKSLNDDDWSVVCNMIQCPAISRAVFCFVKNNNLMSFWSTEDRVRGFSYSLYLPPDLMFMYYEEDEKSQDSLRNLTFIKIHYRLLRLMGLKKPVIRALIKITSLEQKREEIERAVKTLTR